MDTDKKLCEDIINANNPFQCFNLPVEHIEPSAVRALYLRKAVKVHPDKNTSDLATRAFQILSESFEVLHDEEKQEQYLKHPTNWKTGNKSRKKKKGGDIADLVHQTNKWYTQNWEFVESEIQRMTAEFKEHLARKQEKHERELEKRAEKRKRKNKRIKKNLNYLYEKYGIDPSESSDEDNGQDQLTDNYSRTSEVVPDASDKSKPVYYSVYNDFNSADTHSQKTYNVAESDHQCDAQITQNHSKKPESPKPDEASPNFVCWTCRRSFTSSSMLNMHNEKSDLHKQNLEKENNSKGKFKRTFSEIPNSR